MRLILTVAEAARFPEITTWASDSIYASHAQPMGAGLARVTNSWRSGSDAVHDATTHDYTYRNATVPPWNRLIPARELSTILAIVLCSKKKNSPSVSAATCDVGSANNVIVGNLIIERTTLVTQIYTTAPAGVQ